jgi:hypothetical protein
VTIASPSSRVVLFEPPNESKRHAVGATIGRLRDGTPIVRICVFARDTHDRFNPTSAGAALTLIDFDRLIDEIRAEFLASEEHST